MSAEHTVTFPIANRMFGLDSLAKRLNALVSDGQIRDWHPGRWIDWGHTAIRITFDSIEDATLAKTLCLQHTTASHPQLMRLDLAPTATAPERDGDQ
jgi:hypothetical protein